MTWFQAFIVVVLAYALYGIGRLDGYSRGRSDGIRYSIELMQKSIDERGQ